MGERGYNFSPEGREQGDRQSAVPRHNTARHGCTPGLPTRSPRRRSEQGRRAKLGCCFQILLSFTEPYVKGSMIKENVTYKGWRTGIVTFVETINGGFSD